MKNLGLIGILAVLASACSQQVEDQKTTNTVEAWSLRPPLLYQAEGGTNRSFDQFKLQPVHRVNTNDVVTFPDGPDSRIQLEIKTDCTLSDKKYTHSSKGPLPTQISIVQILPPRVWLNAADAPTCSVMFLATNSSGSSHVFDLSNLSIDIKSNETGINLSRTSSTPNDKVDVVFLNRLSEVYFPSKLNSMYDMVCEDGTYTAKGRSNITRLVDFEKVEWPQRPQTQGEACRIIERSDTGMTLGYSETFTVFAEEPQIQVDRLLNERLRYSIREKPRPLQKWKLTNQSDKSVYVALPDISKLGLGIEVVIFGGSRSTYESFDVNSQWETGRTNKNGLSVFEITPQADAYPSIGTPNQFGCNRSTIGAAGYYSTAPKNLVISAFVIADPEGRLEKSNILGTIDLRLNPYRWVGRTRHIIDRQNWDHKDIPYDDFSTLPPPNITKAVGRSCRLY